MNHAQMKNKAAKMTQEQHEMAENIIVQLSNIFHDNPYEGIKAIFAHIEGAILAASFVTSLTPNYQGDTPLEMAKGVADAVFEACKETLKRGGS